MMKFSRRVGIASYGTYLPNWAISTQEIEQAQGLEKGQASGSLGVFQKTVPDLDEDTITIAVEAARQAYLRNKTLRRKTGAVFIGSESHPYAVKPSGTVVKQALDLPLETALADLQFACKAGTQAMQICAAYAAANLIEAGLAIGADTAQAEPGDALEFSAAAGGAAFIIGSNQLIAQLTHSFSTAADTPDFWRRPGQKYPQHAGRFTGEPSYFTQVEAATKGLLAEAELKPKDIDFCVFHTPNAKFPKKAAKKLGFTKQQLNPSLIVKKIGNTYAGASLLALAAVLDQAQANQMILVTSYGSGAGADSFLFKATPLLEKRRQQWQKKGGLASTTVQKQINRLKTINYQTYQSWWSKRGH